MRLPAWQRTLYIVWFTQFVALAGGNLVFPFLPLYIQDLGVHGTRNVAFYGGLTATATGVTLLLFSPVWGSLADRFGRKPLLLRAYFGASITFALQGLAQNVWQLLLLRAIQGAFAGTIPAAAALVASVTPEERIGYSLGLLQMAIFTSGTVGPLIGGLMADAFGFRETFIITGALFMLAGLLLVFGVKETFVPPAERHGPIETMRRNLRDVAASKTVLTMVGLIFLINAAVGFARPVVPLFAEQLDNGSTSASNAGLVFASLAVTSAIAAFAVGHLAHRVGYRRTLLVAVSGVGLAYLPVAAANSVLTLVLAMALVGCFSGTMLPAADAMLSLSSPPDKQGSAFGLAGAAGALALAVAPLLGGTTASLLGFRSVFLVLGVGTLFVAAWSIRYVKSPPPRSFTATESEASGPSDC